MKDKIERFIKEYQKGIDEYSKDIRVEDEFRRTQATVFMIAYVGFIQTFEGLLE